MKKDTTIKLGAALLGAVATTALIGVAVSASQGGFGKFNKRDCNLFKEKRETMANIFENNDYEGWKTSMEGKINEELITEENFAEMAEIHNLMKDGKLEEVKILKEELGLNFKFGKRGMFMKNRKTGENFKAIENNDYEAWKTAMEGKIGAEKLTEENFAKIVEIHNLMKEGKFEEAMVLKEEFGFGNLKRARFIK